MNRIVHNAAGTTALVITWASLAGPVRAQEPLPAAADATSAPAPAAPRTEETEVDPSDALRANLEETISVGEPILRGLPAERLRITRARLANLKRQLKRKETERRELQESLAALRADFYRRTAALNRNEGRIAERTLEEKRSVLREDYELHAESFENELAALGDDIIAIEEKIRELDLRSVIAESLHPSPRVDRSPTSEVGERVLKLPRKLDPFSVESLVPVARGRDHAPAGVLWALQAEIAFHLDELDEAERFWEASLEAPATKVDHRSAILTNLAYVAYRRGDFASSYRRYTEGLGDIEAEALAPEQAYTLAVLSYLNGLVDDARAYLTYTDDQGRRRMEGVLTPSGDAPEA